jgi:precorrin isomerase
MEAYDLLCTARIELLCQMKEQLAFYQRMSHACIDVEISQNYRIRADTIRMVIEQMIQSEELKS